MTSGSPTAIHKRQIGMALQRMREQAGQTRDEIGVVLDCSGSKIGRIERGETSIKTPELNLLLDHFGVDDSVRAELEQVGREARKRRPKTSYGNVIPDWFRKFVNLEEAASKIRLYDGELVPGLLQTEAYTRAVIEANPLHQPTDIEKLIKARQARQRRATADDAPEVWSVLSEAALHLAVGGPEVMHAQLAHLLTLSELEHVTIQISPFDAGAHAATGFNFILLDFPPGGGDGVAYLEGISAAVFRDDAAELAQYDRVFRRLTETALSPSDSREFIARLTDELWGIARKQRDAR